jgi:glycosidase
MSRWVWTTFNSYQWDLNYSNAEVFRAMAEEMLFLANRGVEILRLDAVAFIWKRMGTDCENQPEAHKIIRAFNAMARIVAPALLFKSEAIVHPDEVLRYVHPDECQLSYHPLLMALLWEALATKETKLLEHSLRKRHDLPHGCAWINYIRSHDDIGLDLRRSGCSRSRDRPQRTSRLPQSLLRRRISRLVRSRAAFPGQRRDWRHAHLRHAVLAGRLEDAFEHQDDERIERAVRRITLLMSVQASIGGMPLLYAGDEYGMINDYTYLSDPSKATDSRWVHRCRKRWQAKEDLSDQDTVEWRFFRETCKLFKLRKSTPALFDGGTQFVSTGNPHLLAYLRSQGEQRILVVANFDERSQHVTREFLDPGAWGPSPRTCSPVRRSGWRRGSTSTITAPFGSTCPTELPRTRFASFVPSPADSGLPCLLPLLHRLSSSRHKRARMLGSSMSRRSLVSEVFRPNAANGWTLTATAGRRPCDEPGRWPVVACPKLRPSCLPRHQSGLAQRSAQASLVDLSLAPERGRGRRFVDWTQQSGIRCGRPYHLAIAGDLDNDGDLDLICTGYATQHPGKVIETPTFVLVNDGKARFTPFDQEAPKSEDDPFGPNQHQETVAARASSTTTATAASMSFSVLGTGTGVGT